MTEYADIPTVTSLHGEQERTQQAIDMLAAGGTMTAFTVAPPPPPTTGGTVAPSPLAMSVSISITEEPISPELVAALSNWLATRQTTIIARLATYDVGPPPPPITDPPVNRDVPYAEQQNTVLNCTMGNWDNMQAVGASYAYLWTRESDNIVVGTAANYPIAFADVGVSFHCVVTATNAIGSTTAPSSNSVTVVQPPSP